MGPSKPDVDDQWPRNGSLDAVKVAERLEAFGPAGIAFYAEEGLPWIEVQYDGIVQPAQVVPIGEAIQAATDKPVFFQALRPNSICYILEVDSASFSTKDTDPRLPVAEYGVPLEQLKAAWRVS